MIEMKTNTIRILFVVFIITLSSSLSEERSLKSDVNSSSSEESAEDIVNDEESEKQTEKLYKNLKNLMEMDHGNNKLIFHHLNTEVEWSHELKKKNNVFVLSKMPVTNDSDEHTYHHGCGLDKSCLDEKDVLLTLLSKFGDLNQEDEQEEGVEHDEDQHQLNDDHPHHHLSDISDHMHENQMTFKGHHETNDPNAPSKVNDFEYKLSLVRVMKKLETGEEGFKQMQENLMEFLNRTGNTNTNVRIYLIMVHPENQTRQTVHVNVMKNEGEDVSLVETEQDTTTPVMRKLAVRIKSKDTKRDKRSVGSSEESSEEMLTTTTTENVTPVLRDRRSVSSSEKNRPSKQ